MKLLKIGQVALHCSADLRESLAQRTTLHVFSTLLSTFWPVTLLKGSFPSLSLLQACGSFIWKKQMQELELGWAFLTAFGGFLIYFSPNSRRQHEHHINSDQALQPDPASKCFVEDGKSIVGSPGRKPHQVLVFDPNPCLQAEVKLRSWLSGLEWEAQEQQQQGIKGDLAHCTKENRLSKHEEVTFWIEETVSRGRVCFAGQQVLSTRSVLIRCGGVLKGYASQWDPAAHLHCTGSSVESSAFIFSFV